MPKFKVEHKAYDTETDLDQVDYTLDNEAELNKLKNREENQDHDLVEHTRELLESHLATVDENSNEATVKKSAKDLFKKKTTVKKNGLEIQISDDETLQIEWSDAYITQYIGHKLNMFEDIAETKINEARETALLESEEYKTSLAAHTSSEAYTALDEAAQEASLVEFEEKAHKEKYGEEAIDVELGEVERTSAPTTASEEEVAAAPREMFEFFGVSIPSPFHPTADFFSMENLEHMMSSLDIYTKPDPITWKSKLVEVVEAGKDTLKRIKEIPAKFKESRNIWAEAVRETVETWRDAVDTWAEIVEQVQDIID